MLEPMRIYILAGALLLLPSALAAQQAGAATPAPTDRTTASVFTAQTLAAELAKLPGDRPAASVRVFSLAPYTVSVERRLALPQGASLHEGQAELFYVVDGSATLLTGGKLIGETRNGPNLSGKGLEGGVAQKFAKGDFLIVPSGVPHQFVDIQSPVVLMSLYLPNEKQP